MIKKKKKLCYILPVFDLETDTHYFYLYDFINKVAEDLEVSLIIEKTRSDVSFFNNVSNVKVHRFESGVFRILENFYLILVARIKGNKNFYIHYSQISAFNASIISRLTGARVFYWNCGMMWLFGKKRFLKLILKMVNHLVTGVNILADGYARNYNLPKEKIKIVPNWIDLSRFKFFDGSVYHKYNLKKDINYILFAHRLAKRKGAHYIATLAKEFSDREDVIFLVAGDGPYRKKLVSEIFNLKNVVLLGKVPNKDIPNLMKISRLFCMPSEEEGFPRVLLEAMAAGLPYVAFDIGGVKEISPLDQLNYVTKDLDSVINNINLLLSDSKLYNKIKEINLSYVKKFDINLVVKIFNNLFNI